MRTSPLSIGYITLLIPFAVSCGGNVDSGGDPTLEVKTQIVTTGSCGSGLWTWSSPWGSLTARSNGGDTASGNSCAGRGTYGLQYQCVEITNRFIIHDLYHDSSQSMRIWGDAGSNACSSARGLSSYYNVYSPGNGPEPGAGDILEWNGHTAVVVNNWTDSGGAPWIGFVQQNFAWSSSTTLVTDNVRWYAGSHTFGSCGTSGGCHYPSAVCWIHPKILTPPSPPPPPPPPPSPYRPSKGFSEMLSFVGLGQLYADFADEDVDLGEFYIHANNQDGTFATANWGTGYAAAGSSMATMIGDFDADGYADYADHDLTTGQFWMYRNNWDGTFAANSFGGGKTAAGGSWETLVADFTGDGFTDYADHDMSTGEFWVHANLGNGTFATSNWGTGKTATGADMQTVVGDFNGDGYADYADHNVTTGQFWVHLNSTKGTFSSSNWGSGGATATGSNLEMWVGDFNGDGYADYADHNTSDGQFWIHINNKDGTFAGVGVNWGGGRSAYGSSWQILGLPR